MKTFGEFFTAVKQWAEENGNIDAQIFMEEWQTLVSEEKWQEAMAMEFSKGLFLAFAEDMANYFRERLRGICGDKLYQMTMESGHEFLPAIAEIGKQFGIQAETSEIDTPLSMSDALIRAQRFA